MVCFLETTSCRCWSNLPYRLNANIDSTFSGFKLLFGILLWRNVYSCFILPTSQMLSYTSMMGLINYTTTVWVEHDFALISILFLDFILPFLVVSEENLPTTWCRISPRFNRKKRSLLVSRKETEMRVQLTVFLIRISRK